MLLLLFLVENHHFGNAELIIIASYRAYHPLGPAVIIIMVHIQPVSIVFFFLQTAVSALLSVQHTD